MIDFYDVDLIEQYLLGRLDANQHLLVETKVAKDAKYAQEIAWYQLTLQAIEKVGKNSLKRELSQQQEKLRKKGFFENTYNIDLEHILTKSIEQQGKKKLQNDISQTHMQLKDKGFFDQIYQELDESATPKLDKQWNWRWLAVAASLVLLFTIGGYWLFFSAPSLLDQEFALYPDEISEEIDMQLNATGFKPIDKQALTKLGQAMEWYEQKEFAQAIPLFEQYLLAGEKQWKKEQVQFYLAVTYLGAKETEKAKNILLPLVQNTSLNNNVDIQWYLALCYVESREVAKAKQMLEGLRAQTKYSKQAQKLLEQLQ